MIGVAGCEPSTSGGALVDDGERQAIIKGAAAHDVERGAVLEAPRPAGLDAHQRRRERRDAHIADNQ